MAEVTIVIPLYNKSSLVERAIRSIQEQTFEDWRLIVVDDGSTDDGGDIVRGIADGRIELIRQSNQGPGAARNAGIARAESEFIAFLDADDQWYPWYLANALDAIKKNNVAMVISMFHEWPHGTDSTKRLSDQNIPLGKYVIKGDENPVRCRAILSVMAAWNSLLYTQTVRKHGCFYERNQCADGNEDQILFMHIALDEPFMLIGPAAVRYHTEESQLASFARARPLPPYLERPEVVLRRCPAEKRQLILDMLDIFALHKAQQYVGFGKRFRAFKLLMRYPGAKAYRTKYRDCLFQTIPGYAGWKLFKRIIVKPTIRFCKSLTGKNCVYGQRKEFTMLKKCENVELQKNPLKADKFYKYEGKLATTPIINFIAGHGCKCRGRLLDIGCGKKPYRKYFSQVDEYIGVDIKGEVDIIADAKSLPVESDSIDAVLCSQVIEHDGEPAKIIAEICRVLKKEGILILTAPQMGRLHGEPNDYYRYTKWGLKYLLEKHGLEIEILESQGGFFQAIGSHLNFFIYYYFGKTDLRRKILRSTVIMANNYIFAWIDRMISWKNDTLGYNIMARKKS